MQHQGINTFCNDNIRSIQSNVFQPHLLGNGAMLHPMQHYPQIPFVHPQYAAHYGGGIPSTFNVHGATSGRKSSFLIYFAPEEQATYLRRAKNLGVAPKDCQKLTQQIVQDVNSHIASSKNKNAQRFLQDKTTWAAQSQDISNAATNGSAAAASAAGGSAGAAAEMEANGSAAAAAAAGGSGGFAAGGSAAADAAGAVPPHGGADPPDQPDSGDRAIPKGQPTSGRRQRRPWGLVGNTERKRRALMATKPFREVFGPASGPPSRRSMRTAPLSTTTSCSRFCSSTESERRTQTIALRRG